MPVRGTRSKEKGISKDAPAVVWLLEGPLDVSGAEALCSKARNYTADSSIQHLHVDLGNVGRMPLAGFQVLHALREAFAASGRDCSFSEDLAPSGAHQW